MATKKQPNKSNDQLALLSIILGAVSFTTTIFTGIPAIILGATALRRKTGNQNQAKLGILFGTLGSLLLIPLVIVAVHFLKAPFSEQFAVSPTDQTQMVSITKALKNYDKEHGNYPDCGPASDVTSCEQWQSFLNENPYLTITYPVEYEQDSLAVEDRAPGTIVYARQTTCFVNTPAEPTLVEGNTYHTIKNDNYAAIIFFHDKGRACYPTN